MLVGRTPSVPVPRTQSLNVAAVAPQSSNCQAEADRPRIGGVCGSICHTSRRRTPRRVHLCDPHTCSRWGGPCAESGDGRKHSGPHNAPRTGKRRGGGEVDKSKRRVAAKRNATRNTNKQANAAFAREMKESLAGGRAPAVNVSEGQTHLKSRWHSAAKEVTYNILDLSADGWKAYSTFDKGKVHKELNEKYKFDPPLDPKRVEKYLAGHLRSSRAAWKAHWLKHGDNDRPLNCPPDSWEKLIQWWPTEACMEEAASMVGRRALVQNGSKTGRKTLLERMDEEVRNTV